MTGTHEHVLIELCCEPDSELSAAVVDHSIALRVTERDDLASKATKRALQALWFLPLLLASALTNLFQKRAAQVT